MIQMCRFVKYNEKLWCGNVMRIDRNLLEMQLRWEEEIVEEEKGPEINYENY